MSYTLFQPISSMLEAANFHPVADVPIIFGEGWTYDRVFNRYLRERARGTALTREQGGGLEPTPQSLKTFARWLIDFLEWCIWAKTPWQKVHYNEDLLQRYQPDMQNGKWSTTGESLSPATINNRVSEATYFCDWASRHGFREDFEIAYEYSNRSYGGGRNSKSHKPASGKSRAGKVRANPRDLKIASEKDVEDWLAAVRIKKGATIGLMAKLCIESGIRREECVQWDRGYMDVNPQKWTVWRDHVEVTIKYGAKGPKYSDVVKPNRTTERSVGPTRKVQIPIALAQELLKYRNAIRSNSLLKYVNAAKSPEERRRRQEQARNQDRLFVSEYDGRPIQGETLRRAFKVNPPWDDWSTHLARHYYACRRIARSLRTQLTLRTRSGGSATATPDWIVEAGKAELLLLRDQLGHLDERTTDMYLRWLQRAFCDVTDYTDELEKDPLANGA